MAVKAEQFAESTQHVLLDAASAERTNLLVGVVRHQLERAAERFRAGKREAGVAALTGAFYLTRAGEFRPEMIEGASMALMSAAAEMSRLGDEGRAVALTIQHRHATLSRFFSLFGLDAETQRADIEGIEHHLSPDTLAMLADLAAFFEENPESLKAFKQSRKRRK